MDNRRRGSPHSLFLRIFLWLLAFAMCILPPAQAAQAAVTITSFTATWETDHVLVAWETATELDNAGFYIQRSDSQAGTYTRISELIPSIGDPLTGATYQFTDTDVAAGLTYWYKLETIDLNQTSEYFGPVSAVPPALTPSPTTTGTLVSTPTATFTPTSTLAVSPTASLTPTSTQAQTFATATTRSGTAYPAPATATFQAPPPTNAVLQPTQPLLATPTLLTTTGAVSATAVLSPTSTLIPLPAITLTFPAGGILVQERGTATAYPGTAGLSAGNSGWNPYGGVMLISVIVVIWILLGAWFYMTFRRIE